MRVLLPAIVALLFTSVASFGQLKVSSLFGDNMVIQRGEGSPVWGMAPAGSEVHISVQGQSATGRADKTGHWKISLPQLEAGGPYQMRISAGAEAVVISNVLIGDVYLASGQSNMEWRIENGISTPENARPNDKLRYAKMQKAATALPRDTAALNWFAASRENAARCSAVAFFFAQKLIEEEGVPVGIIENAVGGSPIEAWMSGEMLAEIPAFRARIESIRNGEVALSREDSPQLLLEQAQAFNETFKMTAGADELPDVEDEGSWTQIHFPSSLERAGLYNFDGAIWLRKNFHWPSAPNKSDRLELSLGAIDDNAHVYLNGQYLGSTYGEGNGLKHPVPASVLRQGSNILLVKLHDQHYMGGMPGPEEEMYIGGQDSCRGGRIPLSGEWAYSLNKGKRIGPYYHQHWFEPSVLYNALIHPLLGLNIRGVIWYQGESNSGRGVQYRQLFQQMILDWRVRFKMGHLPFLFVQLANFKEKSAGTQQDYWAELREAQAMALRLPRTAMAVAIDVGQADDIHPRDKQPVGERLALAALHLIYGREVVYSGPVYESHQIVGDTVYIDFGHRGGGLRLRAEGRSGFVIAGADQIFYPAHVDMAPDGRLLVWSEKVKSPEAVRYAWAQNPPISLFNAEGLPAPPFRTDRWPEKSRYR